MRQTRYAASSAMSNLKCHGAFSPLIRLSSRSVGGSVDERAMGMSTARPHTGHLPSVVAADGAKYLEHGSHHGMLSPVRIGFERAI